MRKPPNSLDIEHSHGAFPDRWVNIYEAERITGRTRRAIDRWAEKKLIRRKLRKRKTIYEAGDLMQAVNEIARRQAERRLSGKCRPGPGRGHKGPMIINRNETPL